MAKNKSRSRTWVFTLHDMENWTLGTLQEQLEKMELRYGKVAHEVGKDGKHHFQGYLWFQNAKSFAGLQKIFPGIHLEQRRGTHEEARDYVGSGEKSGSVVEVIEVGLDKVNGGRSDLLAANEAFWLMKEAVDNGATEQELWDDYAPYMFRHLRNIREYLRFRREKVSGGSIEVHTLAQSDRLRLSPGYALVKQEEMEFLHDEQLKRSRHFTSPWNLPEGGA